MAANSPTRSAIRTGAETLLPLAGFSFLALLYYHNAWADPTHLYAGSGGDPQQSMWFLAWIPHALAHHLNPLTTDYLNYPRGANLTWQTSQPMLGLAAAPLTHWFGVVLAYNASVTTATALSGWTAYLALRRFTGSLSGALAGGIFYAFSPYMIGQSLGHSDLLWIASLPLLLMVVHEIFVLQRHRWWVDGIALGAILISQLLISEEVLVIDLVTVLVTVAAAIVLGFQRRWVAERWSHLWRAGVLGGALSAVIGLAPIATQLLGPNRLQGAAQGHDIFATDALGFLFPDHLQWLSPNLATSLSDHFSGNASEIDGYLGLPLVILIGWIFWHHRDQLITRICAVSGIVLALFSFGPHLHLRGHLTSIPMPWWTFDHVPLIDNLLPSRFALAVAAFAAYFIAVAVRDALTNRHLWTTALLLVASVVFLWPARAATATPVVRSAFLSGDTTELLGESNPTLIAPVAQGNSVDAMYWQIESHFSFKQPGGYLVGPPPADPGVVQVVDQLIAARNNQGEVQLKAADVAADRLALRAAGILHAVAGPTASPAEIELLNEIFGGRGTTSDDAEIWTLPE